MISKFVKLLAIAIVILLSSCTGNWEADSIFFDPYQADMRIAQMERQLQQVESQARAASSRTAGLARSLRSAQASKQRDQSQLRSLRSQLQKEEAVLSDMRNQLNSVQLQNDSGRLRRNEIEQEISVLETRIASLRAELLIILEGY